MYLNETELKNNQLLTNEIDCACPSTLHLMYHHAT